MDRDFLNAAQRRNPFLGAAEIERASETKAAQNFDIGRRDVAKMVGPEYLPPADAAAIPAGITPDVAEIAGAGKFEVAG
jgi:hypothetical protein